MALFKKFLNPKDILHQIDLREGAIVADFGCGGGHFVTNAAKIVKDKGKVYAIDIQKTVLSFLKRNISRRGFKNVKLIWADLEKAGATKISENSIDLILISSTLHQTKIKKTVLEEAKRILKEKGRLAILDWKKEATPFGPPVSLRLDEEQIKKEAQNTGFKFLKELKTDAFHFGFLAEKQ